MRSQWSPLVVGFEGLYLPTRSTNLVIVLHELSLVVGHFLAATAYHLS